LQPKLLCKSVYILYQDNEKIRASRDLLINKLNMPCLLGNANAKDFLYDFYIDNFQKMNKLINSRQEDLIIALGHLPFVGGYACYVGNAPKPHTLVCVAFLSILKFQDKPHLLRCGKLKGIF